MKTDFYRIAPEKENNYISDTVYHTIGRNNYCFPVAEQMMGKTVLTKTNREIPEFVSTTPGVILKKK